MPNSPENDIGKILPSIGLDRIIDAIADPESLDSAVFPVKIRQYYDQETGTLRNELDGRGIGYAEGLTSIKGIVRISDDEFRQQVERSHESPTKHTVHEKRLDMKIFVEALRIRDAVLMKTDLYPNSHDINSTGPKFYKFKPNELPRVYKDKHPNPEVLQIEGFNIGLTTDYIIVDLINW